MVLLLRWNNHTFVWCCYKHTFVFIGVAVEGSGLIHELFCCLPSPIVLIALSFALFLSVCFVLLVLSISIVFISSLFLSPSSYLLYSSPLSPSHTITHTRTHTHTHTHSLTLTHTCARTLRISLTRPYQLPRWK